VFTVCALTLPGSAPAGDEPPSPLPAGDCDGAWTEPEVVVGFGDLVPGPYDGWNRQAQRMYQRAQEHARGFADLYGGSSGGGQTKTLTFTFTRKIKARAAELRVLSPYPGNSRFLRACYSIRSLQKIQRVVNDELMFTDEPALDLESEVCWTNIEVKTNQVEVGLEEYNAGDADQVTTRYGPVVTAVQGSCA
jgi:hypothetical protein